MGAGTAQKRMAAMIEEDPEITTEVHHLANLQNQNKKLITDFILK